MIHQPGIEPPGAIIAFDPGAPLTMCTLWRGAPMFQPSEALAVREGKTGWRNSPELVASAVMNAVRLYGPHGLLGVVEHAQPMPKQGLVSTAKYVASAALAHGVLAGAGIRVVIVRPQEWKKAYGLHRDKDASRLKAAALWPEAAHEFRRVKDHDKAEAALMAHFVLRLERQVIPNETG